MADNYLTHSVYLQSADMDVLVIQFPEAAISEKLAPLTAERGLIHKTFYEDFIIGFCLADSGSFFYHVKRRPELMTRFAEIRKEVLGRIYHYTPSLKPANIVVDTNNVLKIRKDLGAEELFLNLEDNQFWDRPVPSSWESPKLRTSKPKGKNPFRGDGSEGEDFFDDVTPDKPGDGGAHDNLHYELVAHLWESVSLYISVRKYDDTPETMINLIGSASAQREETYRVLVVNRCVEDWEDVMILLDQMGKVTQMTPPEIFKEVYEIVLLYNPFLRWDDVDAPALRRTFKDQRRANNSVPRNNRPAKKMSSGVGKKAVQREQKNTFSDVPRPTLLKLGEAMRKHVVGQNEALDAVVDAIQRASVGLKREHEPLGVFMFTGNTGVGKSETAKALSTCLNANLVRIDCQDYQHAHEVSKLAGSPPGYVGHDEGGQLTNAVGKFPFSVVLFDEVEKAHNAFHERLLQIIDDGVLTDNKGNTTSFKDTIIIMTSNIGVTEVDNINKTVGFGAVSAQTEKKVAGARGDALKKKFKPEFLNRIDEIVHFRLLEKDDYMHILEIMLDEVEAQVKKSNGITLKFTPAAKAMLLDKGIDKKFGARPMRRAIKKFVNTPLARAILSEEVVANSKVQVGFSEEKLTFKTLGKVAKTVMTEAGEVEETELS